MNTMIPYIMLISRLTLCAVFQAIIALVFYVSGDDSPWNHSESYWVLSVFLTNIVVFFILKNLFRKDGIRYLDILKFPKEGWLKDILISIGILILCIPLASLPNLHLSRALLGSENVAFEMFFRPLPVWGLIVAFLWAITQGLVEFPTYFKYIMPKLESHLKNGWLAWFITSLFLALQHIAIPLIFNVNFILWRFGMFIPFALFAGLCVKWKPKLFPYYMIIHSSMDLVIVAMLIQVS